MREYIQETTLSHQNRAINAGLGSIRDLLSEAQFAAGTIRWSGNLAVGDTITINGVVFTAVASGATGAQFNIGGSLSATIDNIVTVLNASANGSVTPATYSKVNTDTLRAVHDAAGVAGNAFTLSALSSAVVVTLPDRNLSGGAAGEVLSFPITAKLIYLNVTGASNSAVALPAGLDGQEITLCLKTRASTGNVVVTPSALAGGTTLTFDAVGELSKLQFLGGTWRVVGTQTATLA